MSLPDFALAGSYGCTTKPALKNNINGVETEFPDNVTKIFFNTKSVTAKNEKAKIKKNLGTIRNILKNNAYRANDYTRKYKRKNLSLNLQADCPRIPRQGNLEMLRFPYLGVDMLNPNLPSIYGMILRLPIPTILEQMLKLMKHVQMIRDSGYIHGDIRMENVMIHPETGRMTIIDFDFFQPVNIFFEKYMGKITTDSINVPPDVFINLLRYSRQVFLKYFQNYVRYYEETFVINPSYLSSNNFNVLREIGKNFQETEDFLKQGNSFMSHHELQEKLKVVLVQYLDSYGLGMALMHFLATVYGNIIRPQPLTDAEYSQLNSKFLSTGSISYTPPQIQLIADTLHSVALDIIFPLAHFSLPKRLDISAAIPMMERSIVDFKMRWAEISPLPSSPISSRAPSPSDIPSPNFGSLNAFNSTDGFKGGKRKIKMAKRRKTNKKRRV
jgi:serine/threonine protein kinase